MSTYYFIESKLDGNVIDIVEASTKPGAYLDAYPKKSSGTANQLWEFVLDPAGSGYYFIKSQLDGTVIDIFGGSTAANAQLDAWPQQSPSQGNQLWEFVPDPAGSGYFFIVSKLNGNVIDIRGNSTAAGTLLDAYPLKVGSAPNQLWKVVSGSFPSTVPAAPAPSEGLGSNYNYLLSSNCAHLTGVSVTIDVFQDITGSDGFGFQLNAYSAKSDYDAAQQYLIYLDPHSSPATLYCMVDNWKVQGGQGQIINHIVPLATLASHTLPGGYTLKISLQNDSSGNVTGANYVVTNNTGAVIGNQTITLLSLSGVTSQDLAPIVAFQMDFVDYLNGGNTVLSGGSGSIVYHASQAMTALSAPPSCVDWSYITLETANSSYGILPLNANTTLTQAFQANVGAVAPAITPKPGTIQHKTSLLKT
jgi:Ricin-type beta-trefoil lectin domain-like